MFVCVFFILFGIAEAMSQDGYVDGGENHAGANGGGNQPWSSQTFVGEINQ